MGILSWLILGLIAGFIASKIVNKTGSGLIMDIVLGVVGAFVGGWVFSFFGHAGVTGLNIPSLIVATLGAIVVVLAFHFITRRGAV
ncbi:MAG TPA: GlsB/YeaQ/YmgE family stress response membrane protein [Caulobacteraceae bacterium]|jgi:uncharacterized membrane protein YeaQ/YmgE (transglycosylase-associated protein family)